MATQYLRQCSLVVSSIGGDGLDLSALRITFKVSQAYLQQPNTAEIRVWNLKPETSKKIEKEFTRVTLQAGYGNPAIIFDGTIVQLRRGRANATDTYLDITGLDGDAGYNYAIVFSALAAGANKGAQFKVAADAMAKYNVTVSQPPADDGKKSPRGQVMFGMARDYIQALSDTSSSTWSIQDGKISVVKKDGFLPTQAVVLNSQSGMIGIPEQTVDGINVRSLLNPLFKYTGRVQINEGDINRQAIALSKTGNIANGFIPRLVEDGFYRIVVVNHSGDTRGNDWYSDLVCIALDDSAPKSFTDRGLN